MTESERLWAGSTLAERRAARRAALLNATLDLIGESGGAGVTVRSVCRRAGLTDRYFYESFENRDELLSALFTEVAGELQEALAAVPTDRGLRQHARAAIDAFVGVCLDDPRKGRLLLVEPLSDEALAGASVAMAPTFVELVRSRLPAQSGKADGALIALGLSGALSALFFGWLSGTLRVSRKRLIDHCVDTVLLCWQGHQQPAGGETSRSSSETVAQ